MNMIKDRGQRRESDFCRMKRGKELEFNLKLKTTTQDYSNN